MSDEIQPFINASEYIAWNEANCCHCLKYHTVDGAVVEPICELEEALSLGAITGTVEQKIADRLGVPDDRSVNWTCREKEPEATR